MKTQHTPGPWRVEKIDGCLYIEAGIGKRWNNPTICNLYDDVTPEDSVTIHNWYKPHDNSEANATLIAAAPELLEALEAMLATFEPSNDFPVMTQAYAAIAKAGGEL